jgi:hypothetical protein
MRSCHPAGTEGAFQATGDWRLATGDWQDVRGEHPPLGKGPLRPLLHPPAGRGSSVEPYRFPKGALMQTSFTCGPGKRETQGDS